MGACTLSALLDKPWSQVYFLLPPPRYKHAFILSRTGFKIPHCSSIFMNWSLLIAERVTIIDDYLSRAYIASRKMCRFSVLNCHCRSYL